ncbi:hypothetical protein [Haloarchaeobius amylolyticus]|uniref:hypothetical protein n=1 Tax=Haloarchaeobius amylolyticus TaxID=1198296 RepID=UPI002270DD3F|nr:hypothetical protein [Haloarchaeobius amylolyticus]
MRALPAITLVLALVLAGCGSLGPVTETRQPFSVEQTTQPTEVDDGTTNHGPQFAIDPADDEVRGVRAMLGAHRKTLVDTSYRVGYAYRATSENGTVLLARTIRGAYAENRSHYLVHRSENGAALPESGEWDVFADGDRAFVRRTTENGTSVSVPGLDTTGEPRRPTDLGVFRGRGAVSGDLFQAFAGMNVTSVTELDREPAGVEGPLYRVESTTVGDPQLLSDGANATARNASFEALVTAQGFVVEYRLTFEMRRADGMWITVERRLVYRDVGDAIVPRPEWVDEYTAGTNSTTNAPGSTTLMRGP